MQMLVDYAGRGRRAGAAAAAHGPAQRRLDPGRPAGAHPARFARTSAIYQPGRRDRGLDLVDRLSASTRSTRPGPAFPTASRWPTSRSMSLKPDLDAVSGGRRGRAATSAASAWRRATGATRRRRRRSSSPIRTRGERAVPRPATWGGCCRTATSSSSAATTAGQDPGPPHRAGRDRSAAQAAPAGEGRRGDCPYPRRGQAAARLRGRQGPVGEHRFQTHGARSSPPRGRGRTPRVHIRTARAPGGGHR